MAERKKSVDERVCLASTSEVEGGLDAGEEGGLAPLSLERAKMEDEGSESREGGGKGHPYSLSLSSHSLFNKVVVRGTNVGRGGCWRGKKGRRALGRATPLSSPISLVAALWSKN